MYQPCRESVCMKFGMLNTNVDQKISSAPGCIPMRRLKCTKPGRFAYSTSALDNITWGTLGGGAFGNGGLGLWPTRVILFAKPCGIRPRVEARFLPR